MGISNAVVHKPIWILDSIESSLENFSQNFSCHQIKAPNIYFQNSVFDIKVC
jgi:hypothetical protein